MPSKSLQQPESANIEDAFDIVIVGAGTAGCVLAARLSEDPKLSILLLEAGENKNSDERVYTPGLVGKLLNNPEFDWQYVSEPQLGINGRRMNHPRGRVVGGSSAINSFALVFPNAAGLDAWAELGNYGWDWQNMEKYYRRFLTVCAPSPEVEKQLELGHERDTINETSGPIQASFPPSATKLQKAWVDTFDKFGLRNTEEPLDGHALGGYISTCHISRRSERSHAGVAYLEPALARANLKLVPNALVEKLILERQDDQALVATGVSYSVNGTKKLARARNQVILAAGAFNTPQILELSGIGDLEILHQHNIHSVYHNPAVGQNLQDHIRPGLSLEAAESVEDRPPLLEADARRLYEESRSGPWASAACWKFAYMPLTQFLSNDDKSTLTNLLDEHLDDPSLPAFEQHRNAFIRRMIESDKEATATAFQSNRPGCPDPNDSNWVSLFAMLSHPFSHGTVHINSADPAEKPTIDAAYYSHPLDLEIHARHLLALEKLAATPPLSDCIKRDGRRLPPQSHNLDLEKAKEIIRQYSTTNHHPCGTCSMMPEKMGGVVDDRLRVYGTKNVRVVDASVFPIIPRGNIITTVYAVAEKAADIVREDLSRTSSG